MPRTRQQNERKRQERRREILAGAAKLFATRGLAATKISDVAAEVGMSQGLLYHYFDSKEAIFVEIVRRAFTQMNGAARELERRPQAAREKLEQATRELLRALERSEDFAWSSTLISLASVSDAVPEEARAIVRAEREVPYEVVTRIVEAGQREGSVRAGRAADLALVFWTAVKGLALHKAALGDAFSVPDPAVLTNIFFERATS